MGINYWKEKVLPKIKKVFEKNGAKKAAAAEVIKAFEESKEQYNTEFEGKKTELESKVVEIYEEASPPEVKALIKEPKDAGLKKHSAAVQKFLDELVKIEFPGAKEVSEAATKFGPSYVSGPITFLFEKVSTYIPEEVKKEEEAPAAAPAGEESSAKKEVKEKELVVEAEKKDEVVAEAAAAEKVEPPAEAPPAEAAKVEEAAPAAAAAAEPPKA